MNQQLKDKLDRLAKAAEDVLTELQEEKKSPQTITDLQSNDPKCVICDEPTSHQKLGRDVCEYHWELSNDHKRGR